MLIESTRDSLCFSLAHYKHGKQQHSLQAKSVEEKRLWTHHIKRLILENHHATIPQKAKEAILEMDLFYPPRLPRCSPERLKKSWSCQPLADAATEPLQGRRQSEPFQHQGHTEALLERLQGHGGRRQSGVDSRQDQGARGADELGDTGVTPLPPPLPAEPAKHDLWHLGERGAEQRGGGGEEEEEGEGAASILPPSVLDQASVIAERFGGGGSLSRRSSLALEGPLGRTPSHGGSTLSLDGGPPLESGEPGGSRSAIPSPEPFTRARRESLLSNRDRLLLDKIKSYYGHAEHRDAGFGVRRRESLSFIPKGLVRSSVCRLNGLPRPPESPEPPTQPEAPEPCQENGAQPPEPLLIVEEDDAGAAASPPGPSPQLLLTPPHLGTKVYQLARQYSLRIKSRRAGTRRPPLLLREDGDPHPSTPSLAAPRDEAPVASPSPRAPRSPPSPVGAEPFAWPDVRELRARFGAPRPPPVSRSRSAPEGPGRGGRPAGKERGGGRSRSAEANGGSDTPSPAPARYSSDGALWVAAEAPLGPGQRVLVLERLPEPPTYVQIRSPTTREKICLKAVVERCKAYQASEEYRRRCPEPPGSPEPLRHGLVRDLRQKFQTLDAAS
ncbi:hypothetical protein DUI87_25492 [Hirundo rustica rustica]|uniref:PH domain-containing protein n=1 Tax=Hirundo rustica rustica TaxID=333673 RepID=A0A3M0JB12_HIRRU|nr:hypothetical protein DUI87_25492 [Hirundo rustica rustica]